MSEQPTGEQEPNPIDQLMDLLVHAPIGLLYERDKVMETVVKRGRSQVQLARLMAGMARQQIDVESKLLDAAGAAGTVVARGITDVGTKLGLAPEAAEAAAERVDAVVVSIEDAVEPATEPTESSAPSLPIAGYDDLRAKDIVPLLADLTPAQRAVVADHEASNRARKTVLGKLAQLDG